MLRGACLRIERRPGVLAVVSEGDSVSRADLEQFLQNQFPLDHLVAQWSHDPHLTRAAAAFPGLRLLRQDPWECLASFICSSTKRIVQIKEIVRLLAEGFGEPAAVRSAATPWHCFPTPESLAAAGEAGLRSCKLGYRAGYLAAAARMVAEGRLDLAALGQVEYQEALRRLLEVPGVGPKIANCVLLFALGHPEAFPVDVWVAKSLHRLYFPRRKPKEAVLARFITKRLAPHPGYAQQYLFHYERLRGDKPSPPNPAPDESTH